MNTEFHSICSRKGNKFNQVSTAVGALTTCLINSKYAFLLVTFLISVILWFNDVLNFGYGVYLYTSLLYPQTKVGDILDSGPSRRRRRRRNFLVDAITQKQINIFFSNLVHMLRVPKGRSLF